MEDDKILRTRFCTVDDVVAWLDALPGVFPHTRVVRYERGDLRRDPYSSAWIPPGHYDENLLTPPACTSSSSADMDATCAQSGARQENQHTDCGTPLTSPARKRRRAC